MTLDLNLLVSLDALLRERSVTRAADRLGLSQPTLSASLGRLRRHFGDDLLLRAGNQYQLTPLAERLLAQTPQALAWANRIFDNRGEFDPAGSQREFTVIASDGQLPGFGAALARIVHDEAPGVRLRFQHSTVQALDHASEVLRSVDGLVTVQGLLSGLPNVDLYQDRWVCVVSSPPGEPVDLTVDDLRNRPWVLPYHSPSPALPALHRLRAADVDPRAEISVENFLAMPYLVTGTDRIGLMPERVARLNAGPAQLCIAGLPLDLGVLVESLWWHPMHDRDPGHRWFRQTAGRAADLVAASGQGANIGD